MEPDLRAADRDLREIHSLDTRGVTSAGKLGGMLIINERLSDFVSPNTRRTRTIASKTGGIA